MISPLSSSSIIIIESSVCGRNTGQFGSPGPWFEDDAYPSPSDNAEGVFERLHEDDFIGVVGGGEDTTGDNVALR